MSYRGIVDNGDYLCEKDVCKAEVISCIWVFLDYKVQYFSSNVDDLDQ